MFFPLSGEFETIEVVQAHLVLQRREALNIDENVVKNK